MNMSSTISAALIAARQHDSHQNARRARLARQAKRASRAPWTLRLQPALRLRVTASTN
jgi:hypothetical protein